MTPSNQPTQAPGALISESERARITSSVRMTFALIAMVALIVAGLTGLIFYLVSSVFDSLTPAVARDLEWKVRRGAVELSKTAELGILVGDEVTVRNAARDYLNSPDVVNVVVTGATGDVVFAHGDDVPHVLGVLQRPSGQVYAFDGRLVAWAPATIEGGEVGRVAVAMSTARLEAGDALRRQISWTAIAGSVFAMLLALGFVSLYIWPVLRLTQAAFVRLEHTTEQALEAARLKAQFLANMSHEIRTPMNAVVGLSKLMLGMQLNHKLRRYAEMIEASSRALLSIINDILDFSKLEAGKYQIIAAPTELAQVVQEVAELLAERAHEKGLDLVYRIAPEVPRVVEVDGDRVRQVLMNLVGNAIKFTERGEVYILVEAKALPDERVELKVSVQDTGPGVPPDLQAQIFEAFSQGDGSLVRKHGGTGLGLTISKEMVRLMGGGMGLESQQGKGSTFWFWLPGRVLDPVSAVRGQAASLGARALITCPNEHARMTITEHVVAWGMEAKAAASPTQTQEELRGAAQANQHFDVVIIAETQSGGSGSETVQAVRGLERERMPIVLLTYTRPELEPANTQNEVTAQLTQPVRMSDLYNTLASVLKPGSVRPANKQVKEAALRYRGVRVLVVDDNQMNQFVAAEQLGLFGCNVDQAFNGQEAVDAVLKNDYAVVFMDCQMPVMDGYTATRIIRERESPDKRNKIIALTAHALEGERERVVSVGMDDYLTKPLRPQTLQRALQRWIKVDDAPGEDMEPEAFAAPEPPSNKPSLQAMDFSDCSTPLLLLFLEQVPMQLEQLDGAIAVRELDEARAYAHKLKGSLLTVGADELANVAQAAQFAAERSELQTLDAQIAKLIDGFWKLEKGVKKELAARGGARKAGAHG